MVLEQNKQNIETELDNLKPTGTTNMWDGIKTCSRYS